MRLAIVITFLVFIGTIAFFIWQWWKARADLQKLRENPPQKIALLIRLPREAEKSNIKMTRFFARIERLVSHDKDAIATNDNVISAALVGSGKGQGQAPQVRFILWSPPELAERVMMELQECYEGQAQVTELKPEDDPLGSWLQSHSELRALQQQIEEQEK